MKILQLLGIKQIYNIFLNIKEEIDTKRYENNCINEYETKDMKFVWGLQSYDDLSKSNTANLYTMNDIDLIYLKDEKKYVLGIETAYLFDNKSGEYKYVEHLLNKFTEFMEQNNYDTSKELDVYEVFTEGININTHFDSIEDAYTAFKMLVNGFCSLKNKEKGE